MSSTSRAVAGGPPPPRGVNVPIYSAAQGISSIGAWMQRAGIGWLAWELTHSPGWVGALALTEVITALWVTPLAGALADRQSPYRVLMITQSLMIVQALALCAYVWSGTATIWGLFGLALADSTIAGFNAPVRMTVVNQIAPPDRLSQAIASNSMFFNLARVIGPAIAGAIMATGHIYPVFGLNALTYIAFVAAINYLRPWIDRPVRTGKGALFEDIGAGFRYIGAAPRIATLFALAAVFSLLSRPFNELLPAVAGEMFQAGPQGLSALMSVQGAGAFIGAAAMLRRHSTGRILVIGFVTAGLLPVIIAVFLHMPTLALALPVAALAGLVHVVCNISMQSLAQTFAEAGFRGRVMAVYGLLFRAGPALGAFLIGLAAERWGIGALLTGACVLGVILTVWIGLKAPRVYRGPIDAAQ
jgi:predicted MFS family arabinose efflux permease